MEALKTGPAQKTPSTMEYYTAMKMNERMPFASNMDGPSDYHTK